MIGYLAAEGFEAELDAELSEADVVLRHGRLRLVTEAGPPPAWAQNTWLDVERVPIRSIKDAARTLRERARNWALLSVTEHRRATLIENELPRFTPRPIPPYASLPSAPLGSWTLLDRDTLLCAPRCTSPFPHGEVQFVEDRHGPASRAYKKLWELFTLEGLHPRPGDRVLDLGSAPGGWTWVLAELGCDVISVDKAELEPRIAARREVTFMKQSAFALDPTAFPPFDWIFSDVICYPPRLLALVERWMAQNPPRRFACSIKFQGATDHAVTAQLASFQGARLRHLSHNRHELTWTLGV